MADNKVNFLRGTSAEYEAKTKDNDTFYYTTDTKKLYLGENEVGNGIDPKVIQAHIDNQTIHAKVWRGTQAEYNAIEPKEDDTVYIIKDSDNTLADKLIDDTSTTATDKTWSAKKINENDEVARAAIGAHTGNAEIHATAEEKAAWNGKAELADIPTTLPANGGNADTLGNIPASELERVRTAIIGGETAGAQWIAMQAKKDDTMIRVQVDADYNRVLLFKSIDGGVTWTEMPLGNADTVDGKHAESFMQWLGNISDVDFLNNANYKIDYHCNLGNGALIGLPIAGWYHIVYYMHSNLNGFGMQIAYPLNFDGATMIRRAVDTTWGDWKNVADGGNAMSANHQIQHRLPDGTDVLTYATSDNCLLNVNTKVRVFNSPTSPYGDGTNESSSDFIYDIFKIDNHDWMTIIAYDVRSNSVYVNSKINGTWLGWTNIADGGNAATVNGYTVNANIPAGFSPIGQNTENKTYTYKEKTYTGSNTSEVFNDYTNNMAADTYSHAEGNQTKALGSCSHAEGYNTKALGSHSHAEGYSTKASAPWSHAEGYSTQASAPWSHAEGYSTTTSGDTSHAEGFGTTASGTCSHAEGEVTTASSYASHACGKFNKAMSDSTSKESNVGDVFVIGNGIADNNLSNAFRITYTGATYGLSAFNSSGADYAEFIKPWHDNNIDNEDRVGYFVTIKNGLLYKANEGDYIVGITSGNPSVVGNADEDYYWRYERDEFNRFVYEDAEEEVEQLDDDGAPVLDENGMPVMVKTGNIIKNAHYKLAADYDPTKQNDYIERKNRPEWSYVGMIGVLPVRDDGTCVAGGFAKCDQNGIATRAESRGFDTFFVIERISDNVVSVEIR